MSGNAPKTGRGARLAHLRQHAHDAPPTRQTGVGARSCANCQHYAGDLLRHGGCRAAFATWFADGRGFGPCPHHCHLNTKGTPIR